MSVVIVNLPRRRARAARPPRGPASPARGTGPSRPSSPAPPRHSAGRRRPAARERSTSGTPRDPRFAPCPRSCHRWHASSLITVVRGGPCPDRAQERGKWREWEGRVGYGGGTEACDILTPLLTGGSGGAVKLTARVKLTLLGGFQAQLGADAPLALPTRKTQALLAYLALPLGQAHSRDKLATLLWGDMPDAQARGNLRHALSRIRKTLPAGARHGLILDGPTVALDPSVVDVDVAQFERLVADGQPPALEQIGGLYRGDLLAGLALTEPPFDEWLTSEPERPRRPRRPISCPQRWPPCRRPRRRRPCRRRPRS